MTLRQILSENFEEWQIDEDRNLGGDVTITTNKDIPGKIKDEIECAVAWARGPTFIEYKRFGK